MVIVERIFNLGGFFMKRNYKLQGLDCAVCANNLESIIKKIKGVKDCSISFMTLKMVVEVEDENADEILSSVIKTAEKFEDGITLKRC